MVSKQRARKAGKRLHTMIVLGFKQFRDPYYQGIAAQVAFFFLLSVVPTTLLLSQLFRFFNISAEDISSLLNVEIPREYSYLIAYIMGSRQETSTNLLLTGLAVWAASRVQFTLIRVTHFTNSEDRDAGKYWRERGKSMLIVILTVILLAVIAAMLVYGDLFFRLFARNARWIQLWDTVWQYMKWPVAGAVYLLLIAYNYYVLSVRKIKFRDIMPGSIFCATGMLLVTVIYSFYADHAVNNNILYGPMASLAVLMFWFYFMSWVLVLGILFNKVWADTK